HLEDAHHGVVAKKERNVQGVEGTKLAAPHVRQGTLSFRVQGAPSELIRVDRGLVRMRDQPPRHLVDARYLPARAAILRCGAIQIAVPGNVRAESEEYRELIGIASEYHRHLVRVFAGLQDFIAPERDHGPVTEN